jgi:hypothetical protein
MSITRVGQNVVVMTKSSGFLGKTTDYVVAKRTCVTDGYGQGGDISKKLTMLEAPVLLGWSGA